jgi:hypothetical protein
MQTSWAEVAFFHEIYQHYFFGFKLDTLVLMFITHMMEITLKMVRDTTPADGFVTISEAPLANLAVGGLMLI